MKFALVMFVVLVVLMFYRRFMQMPCIQRFLHESMPISAFFFQYYTLLLGCLVGAQLDSAAYLMLELTPVLRTPEDVTKTLNETLHSTQMTPQEVDMWRHELQVNDSLQRISFHAPVAVALTFIVVAVHVFHLVRDHNVNGLTWCPTRRQDWILQVLLLPAMYAVMAERCVIRSWEVFLGSGFRETHSEYGTSWKQFVQRNMELYDANFAVANFAEMYTVWCFSRLLLDLLAQSFSSRENHFVFRSLAMQGFHGFVFCGLLKALCQLLTTSATLRQELVSGSYAQQLGMRVEFFTEVDNYLRLLLVLASVQCVYNGSLICWMSALSDINPSLKFTGTRALVMFAQWQSFGLDFASQHGWIKYNTHQVRLLHASLMCYECLAVSVLHVFSWPPEDFDNGYIPLEDRESGRSWRFKTAKSTRPGDASLSQPLRRGGR